MTALAYYLLKVILCSGVLYLYYALALKNKLFHQWNRAYLLASILLSLLLPLLQVAIFSPAEESDAASFIKAVQAADNYLENITITTKSSSFDTAERFLAGYVTGILALLYLLAISLWKIKRLIQTHKVQAIQQIKFVNTREPGTPFSFLRYIFWNEDISLQSETGRWIFEHEVVHVTEKHTADKLFMQLVLSFFWCNPFFWLMRRELSFVHEFIADKKAIGNAGAASFAAAVLQTTFPKQYSSITNPFFQLSIKRRLAMLTKQNNPRLAYAARIVALPFLAFVIFAFSVRTKSEVVTLSTPLPFVTSKADTLPKKEKQILSVDVKKAKGLLTIYYHDGSCETLTEKEANNRGLIHDGGYGNEKRGMTKLITAPKAEIRMNDTAAKPLIVVDGTEVPYSLLNAVDPNKIQSINVLKNYGSTSKYGDKGKNGVIEITLKKNASNGLEPVEVTGRPSQKEVITLGTTDALGEVTVVGHPLQQEPVFEKTETPASIDKEEWRTFLSNNLQPLIKNSVNKGMKPGTYVVNVRFVVKKDGTLADFQALNNPGYDLDKQILAIMPGSPKWKPAEQNGKPMTSYHTQPITFMIEQQ
jgi:hypothetical protein